MKVVAEIQARSKKALRCGVVRQSKPIIIRGEDILMCLILISRTVAISV